MKGRYCLENDVEENKELIVAAAKKVFYDERNVDADIKNCENIFKEVYFLLYFIGFR